MKRSSNDISNYRMALPENWHLVPRRQRLRILMESITPDHDHLPRAQQIQQEQRIADRVRAWLGY